VGVVCFLIAGHLPRQSRGAAPPAVVASRDAVPCPWGRKSGSGLVATCQALAHLIFVDDVHLGWYERGVVWIEIYAISVVWPDDHDLSHESTKQGSTKGSTTTTAVASKYQCTCHRRL
ncbi:unnamed protein product, partial [Ectocarpus sp. 8 AP-2014]